MGPRSFNRGNVDSGRSAACLLRASMGPRSFNRGNDGTPMHSLARRAASMGPRSFNRGNRSRDEGRRHARQLQWGRGLSTAEMTDVEELIATTRRFNGAAVFQPRKSAVTPTVVIQARRASMGPRSFNRGDPVVVHDVLLCGAASMGPRSFNRGNAGASCRVRQPEPLQWGRGLSTAEMASEDEPEPNWITASMGPRSFNRGNVRRGSDAHDGRPCFNGAAVFQPRKWSLHAAEVPRAGRLQWGRGLSTAEMASRLTLTQAADVLQWGRGLSTAEMWRADPASQR